MKLWPARLANQPVSTRGTAIDRGIGARGQHDRARRHFFALCKSAAGRFAQSDQGSPSPDVQTTGTLDIRAKFKIYNYDLFDPAQNLFGGLTVLEIDPVTFEIRRRVFAAARSGQKRRNFGCWSRGGCENFPPGPLSATSVSM